MSTASTVDDEHLFAQAMAEIESGQPQPGLWAKAFADADGDERKAKARYLTLRVKALSVRQAVAAPDTCLASPNDAGGRPDASIADSATVCKKSAASAEPPAKPSETESLGRLPLIHHTIVCLVLVGWLMPAALPEMGLGSAFWWAETIGKVLAPAILAGLVFLVCSLFFPHSVKSDGKRLWVRILWICALIGLASYWYVDLSRAEAGSVGSESASHAIAQTSAPTITASAPATEMRAFPGTTISAANPDRFKPLSGGAEIHDTKTSLIWRRCVERMRWAFGRTCSGEPGDYTFDGAQAHAALEARRTGKSWRVPNKDELVGIVDEAQDPTIDPVAFPATPVTGFWSSSPIGVFGAWGVSFVNGGADYYNQDEVGAVRLVRSSQ